MAVKKGKNMSKYAHEVQKINGEKNNPLGMKFSQEKLLEIIRKMHD